ncbi:hypothetical protein K466DRAFT_495562 [Polyporus arcularius HHB13444]|uniref:Uncharacterized protein n=1 Tax=Polyporus arcularius HHB13444 TaxID=1314778 RepID=A0A5C3PGH6_9APHY|nr:hypothetical protein K466DRAFT_495562 [Polyporus arcularius HHB13444]
MLPYFVRALLYPAESMTPVVILVPASASADLEPGQRYWLEDLSVDRWFPNGWQTQRVSQFPETSYQLRNHYTIYTSAETQRSRRNLSLVQLGVRQHRGNVLVLRTSSRQAYEVTNVHSAERALIDLVVTRYVFVNGTLTPS